jgi:hypothetical protein
MGVFRSDILPRRIAAEDSGSFFSGQASIPVRAVKRKNNQGWSGEAHPICSRTRQPFMSHERASVLEAQVQKDYFVISSQALFFILSPHAQKLVGSRFSGSPSTVIFRKSAAGP